MWKEHPNCARIPSSTTSCLHGLGGAPHPPEPHNLTCAVWVLLLYCLAGGVHEKMLHPRVLKFEGVLESPGGFLNT